MVVKTNVPWRTEAVKPFSGPVNNFTTRDSLGQRDLASRKERRAAVPTPPDRLQVDLLEAEESVDVIDLGAPRRLCRAAPDPLPGARPARAPRRVYTPNPRLYPGPAPKPKRKRPQSEGGTGRTSRRRLYRRPVPNSRLYRPAPRRLPPPPQPPRGPWPPPAPLGPRVSDTASRAALRLAAVRLEPGGSASAPLEPPPAPPPPRTPRARRLVVTLPAAGAGMDAAARHSTSPDDCSDGDAPSAPSEFLAEFLSAIMRRQYAEALKYCRLILQYEPHNATARGFFPLLQHKVQALKRNEGASGSSSGSSYSPARRSPPSRASRSLSHSGPGDDSPSRHEGSGAARVGRSRSGSESGGSVASQSSLELDSSSGRGSPSARSDTRSGTHSDTRSGTRSDTRSNTRSRSDPDSDARDDNGNLPHAANLPRSDDVENDNDVSRIKSESPSLRRLRAQFACSIK